MSVSVQTLAGSNLEFSSLKNGTVMDLKLCIQQEISLDPEEQALFLNGVELMDEEAISDEMKLNLVARVRGGVMMEPTLQVLARKYNCDKMVCRKCYNRLPLRSHNCRSKMCGHTNELRMKFSRAPYPPPMFGG